MNKKGAEMTVGTIVVIVLVLIVLVVVALGFTGAWGQLWSKITNFFGGGANVQTVVQACGVACTAKSDYDYCSLQRSVKFGDDRDTLKQKYSCYQLEGEGVGLSACPDIDCDSMNLKSCESLGGEPVTPVDGKCPRVTPADTKSALREDLTPQVTDKKTARQLCCKKP